jgi:hypothetical protein
MPTKKADKYLKSLPATKIPSGSYLVHNHVRPARPLGQQGFRAWMTEDTNRLVKCTCDFGGNDNAEVNPHYRIKPTTA